MIAGVGILHPLNGYIIQAYACLTSACKVVLGHQLLNVCSVHGEGPTGLSGVLDFRDGKGTSWK